MHLFSGKVILIIMVISLGLGLLVIALDSNYTMKNNVDSNRDYYPSVKIAEVGGSNAAR
ncbi:MAG TPA: hypothetical protein PKM88_12245 [bacterium]|nr:hypothetical protein [bacterium]